jgi:fluoride exporter
VTYLYIIAGACAGAPLRYFVGTQVKGGMFGGFPLGTFLVNVTGCLLIGVVLGIAESRDLLSREVRLLLVTGFLGSYTTFSAFGWETYDLIRGDQLALAVSYAALSVAVGLVAVWAGVQATRL